VLKRIEPPKERALEAISIIPQGEIFLLVCIFFNLEIIKIIHSLFVHSVHQMVHIFSHCILSKLFGTLVFLENRIIGAFAFIVRLILHPNPHLLAPIKDHL
jgi:hypothetical protein